MIKFLADENIPFPVVEFIALIEFAGFIALIELIRFNGLIGLKRI